MSSPNHGTEKSHPENFPECVYIKNSATDHQQKNERRTRWVVLFTLLMMILEIGGGWLSGSMALLADGWHMGTHAAALGIALFAYWYARRNRNNPRFTFGTGKVNVLAGYTSALGLAIAGAAIVFESIERLVQPVEIMYTQALVVAVLGLVVNLISAFLLREDHTHDIPGLPSQHVHAHHIHNHKCNHEHEHNDEHEEKPHGHTDHNLRAAYLHVIADALTSVCAIVALLVGSVFGWGFLDPLVGVAGGAVIIKWALSLLWQTSRILLDADVSLETVAQIKSLLEQDGKNHICDLHVWRLNGQELGAMVLLHHDGEPEGSEYFHQLLQNVEHLKHIIIEERQSEDCPCAQ